MVTLSVAELEPDGAWSPGLAQSMRRSAARVQPRQWTSDDHVHTPHILPVIGNYN